MAVDEGSVATTALVIAMAAFVIACGQLLQQLFATADGLRRCQNSVIGGWSQLVQVRFRWSSFRFEVRVVTPHFVMARSGHRKVSTSVREWKKPPDRLGKLLIKDSSLWCDASTPVAMISNQESRRWTTLETIQTAFTEEPVTWLSLISDIHDLQDTYGLDRPGYNRQDEIGDAALLCFTRHTRSWDFMPVEIVRPFASTTIGCLVSIVHRMNLTWIDLRPDEGVIRATGHGRSISASRIRGLGLVVEYIRNGTKLTEDLHRRIDSDYADKMACGILPGGVVVVRLTYASDLPLRDQAQPVEAQLSRTFRLLDLNYATIKALHESLAHKNTKQALPAFADLLGLWTDWLPQSVWRANVVENPFPIEVEPMGKRPESRVVWQFLLQRHPSNSPQIKRVLSIYNEWENLDPTRFHTLYDVPTFDETSSRRDEYSSTNGYILAMRSFFKRIFDETELYFNRDYPGMYRMLVLKHVAINAQSLRQAEKNIRTKLDRPHPQVSQSSSQYQGDPIFSERAFVYVENIPKIISIMRSVVDAKLSFNHEEAWWMMMIRMQAWNMGVKLVTREGLTVPHHYYDDPSRVYIL